MNNFKYLFFALIVVLIDQTIKFNSIYVLNQNFIFGSFFSLSIFIKSILSVTIFLIVFSSFIFFQFLLIPDVKILRYSSNLLMFSLFSNSLDKLFLLGVRDNFYLYNFHFNFADIVQLVSFPAVIFSLFFYSEDLWNERCLRKNYKLISQSQKSILKNILILFLVISFSFGLFFVSFLSYLKVGYTLYIQFLATFILFTFSMLFISYLYLINYSNRIVGPILSLINYLKIRETEKEFKVRKGDPIIELENIAKIIKGEDL